MDPAARRTEKRIMQVRRSADYNVDNYFNDRYVMESGFARLPIDEREAVRFVVRKRLQEAPSGFYGGLGYIQTAEVAEKAVRHVIENYNRYAGQYQREAENQDIHLPSELPAMKKFGWTDYQGQGVIQHFDGQLRRLNEHLQPLEEQVEKENDPDALIRMHDEYAKHREFVHRAVQFLEKHSEQYLKHHNVWAIQLAEKMDESDYKWYHAANMLRLAKAPEYPPLGVRFFHMQPEYHALHDMYALGSAAGAWGATSETLQALFKHRLSTLLQYRLGLDGFLSRIQDRIKDLRTNTAPRARQTQKLKSR